jgi:methionyl aminopeptidase
MIICKSPAEIEKLRRSGHLVREILQGIQQRVRPGVSTLELEKYAEKSLAQAGARPALKVIAATHAVCARR